LTYLNEPIETYPALDLGTMIELPDHVILRDGALSSSGEMVAILYAEEFWTAADKKSNTTYLEITSTEGETILRKSQRDEEFSALTFAGEVHWLTDDQLLISAIRNNVPGADFSEGLYSTYLYAYSLTNQELVFINELEAFNYIIGSHKNNIHLIKKRGGANCTFSMVDWTTGEVISQKEWYPLDQSKMRYSLEEHAGTPKFSLDHKTIELSPTGDCYTIFLVHFEEGFTESVRIDLTLEHDFHTAEAAAFSRYPISPSLNFTWDKQNNELWAGASYEFYDDNIRHQNLYRIANDKVKKIATTKSYFKLVSAANGILLLEGPKPLDPRTTRAEFDKIVRAFDRLFVYRPPGK
jgi:hypothetical protein